MIKSQLRKIRQLAGRVDQFRWKRRLSRFAVIGDHFVCTAATYFTNVGQRDQITLGNYVTLLSDELRCYEMGRIKIGDYVWMSLRGQIISCSAVEIGNHCLFARDVYISDTNEHPIDTALRRRQTIDHLERNILPDRYSAVTAPIKIGNDVWVGERTIILKGVQIGDASIVAAGAVVTKSFPEKSLIGGNPARLLRQLP